MRHRSSEVFQVLVIVLAIHGACLSAARADLEDGLVAHWGFNECSGSWVRDASGHGNDGYNFGGSWVTTPFCGCALELTNTGAVEGIPASWDDTISGYMTVSTWVEWYGVNEWGQSSYVFDSRDAGPGDTRYGALFRIDRSTAHVTFQLLRGYNSDYITVTSNFVMPLHTWVHLAAVLDQSTGTLSLYVNGSLDNAVPAKGGYMQSDLSPAIGNNRWAPPWATLNGVVDEMRIYERALSPSEILSLSVECDPPTPAEGNSWGEIKDMFR